ncbi:M50 family metallopeptidase [bacterium]|nr:M50 family metallopeptidase [bacterium]
MIIQEFNLKKIAVLVILTLLLGLPATGFFHEFGHGATAILLGGRIDHIWLFPGIELFPDLGFSLIDEFPCNLGGCGISGLNADWKVSVESLMGSGCTLIAAYLIILWPFLREAHWSTCLTITFSLPFAWDIILYSTLPLAGLRHAVFLGGEVPEPLIAARDLGVSYWVYFSALIFHVLLFHTLLVRVWRKKKIQNVIPSDKGIDRTCAGHA